MALQRRLLQMQMQLLLATWSARIRYHGPRPVPAANRVRLCPPSCAPLGTGHRTGYHCLKHFAEYQGDMFWPLKCASLHQSPTTMSYGCACS